MRVLQQGYGAPAEPDGVQIRTFAAGFPGGHIIPDHLHGWHQLIYGTQGVITVHTSQGSWVVPPQRAVWVPAGIVHRVEMSGAVSMRTLYITVEAAKDMSKDCCVVNVSPLLRELILHAIEIGALDKHIPTHARLIGVILDQIIAQPAIPLQLAVPSDSRALKVVEILRANPGDTGSLEQFCRTAGASKRTIERLFRIETGMTFGQWRQRLRLLHGLRLLASGEPVTTVAMESGYESTSAFISVFKTAFGTTPSRYYPKRDLTRT
jgi:AraC-like DNA-binding protein/quercetin dioxygenase-like cupin family protein